MVFIHNRSSAPLTRKPLIAGVSSNINAMDYTKELVGSIKPILKLYGFTKKSLNWFWEDNNIIKIFNIQKSFYSKKIYLNIGIKIKSIGESCSYTFPGSHIASRLDDLVGNDILDFENSIDLQTRCDKLAKLLSSDPYGFFKLSSSKESLKQFIVNSGTLIVTITAKKYLELE